MPMFMKAESSKILLSNDFSILSKEQPSKDLHSAIRRYSKYISSLTGKSIKSNQNIAPSEKKLIINCASMNSENEKYPALAEDESYALNITNEGSYLYASTLTGTIRGLSTFVQLIERSTSSDNYYIPIVYIIDRPRFTWRGLMLDVSRHWMPVSVIERTLNAMELSKLNVLHLHLSDDQGFRVESIQHKLLHDRKDFFTQKDIRYIVEYARQRRIRIVPEFDIPGHTTSWFVGYPELATEPGPYQISTTWGVIKSTMDPTKETTYTFLDTFFEEMTKLFPDPYFHIGGDEVEGTHWAESPTIQKFMSDHRLINKNGLQAYFNKRVQVMLKKYGKIMIGWEEILDEMHENLTIDNDAIIQSWKSRKALVNSISKGYRSILSHGYYLDHLLLSSFHYKVDPILNDELWLFNQDQLGRILGGEACMWTEFAAQNSIDSRIWPRVLTMAERFWSSSSVTNQNFLYERLFHMNYLLDKMQTGLTHLSTYRTQLQNLILDSDKKASLLHPFAILADVCEPYGFDQRTQSGKYTSQVPLTTFTDILQCESELIWRLENMPIDDKKFRDIFQTWSLNHVRLRSLFDALDQSKQKQLWGQDIQRLSENLAQVGRIGLATLNYGIKGIFYSDNNSTMNSMTLAQWALYQNTQLTQLENQVFEVRLAAVRPVRRLLNSIQIFV
ncbi:unnamed protein product [Rotaria magnacalcarata]|uniref:beta-N-acetylhexosaminidase n=1 Tax=Rotaria magnacalcarata TaxID=392030 RepID=A0A816ST41_9BILA|nr:unnamed protein product [Rotaria magnacalcarata]CAF1637664.1 unnamed protein product [Rotaria magnacalcarata]CAF2090758.1 unnamed protein product [Rotaria magnacalcarata]CAF3894656.1 unnamed protein product [Rotaria magnacalcarata]CAF4091859.1 unnamed protein product [Rotaria magnacalcarata]